MNYTEGRTPIMFVGTTVGVLLEPYVMCKATNMWNTWTIGGPPRACYNWSRLVFDDLFWTVVLP